jgi:ribosomal protein S18 acetylase RimI-like enzyme
MTNPELGNNPEDKEKLKIEILDATPEEAQGIVDVQRDTWFATYPNEEYGITLDDIKSRNWDDPERPKRWQRTIETMSDKAHTWVAKVEGKVIGFCSASKGEDKNQIRAIYLLPEYQGKGAGKKLISTAFEWLGSDKDVSLEVVKYNKQAIDFYKRMGFGEGEDLPPQPAGQLPSGKVMPEIEMIKPKEDDKS